MKVNISVISWTVIIASTTKLFFFSTIAFKVGCSVLSEKGLASFDLDSLRLFSYIRYTLFKDFATFCSLIMGK